MMIESGLPNSAVWPCIIHGTAIGFEMFPKMGPDFRYNTLDIYICK